MKQQRLIFNVYDWRTRPLQLCSEIEAEIDKLIGDTVTGCVVVTLAGPMNGQEAQQPKP